MTVYVPLPANTASEFTTGFLLVVHRRFPAAAFAKILLSAALHKTI
jgi:hypothetical protein